MPAKRSFRSLFACTFALASASLLAQSPAGPPSAPGRRAPSPAAQPHVPGAVLDRHHDHDRYYPPKGDVVTSLPPGYAVSRWHGEPYYYHSGVWYRPERSHWIVVVPPIGLVVPFLPPFYTTIWIGGIPYYYANNVYYAWQPTERNYVVVEPPAETTVAETSTTPDTLYVYPKNGQTEAQLTTDRYECHRWAAKEAGYDPTQPLGGVAADEASGKRAGYFRAMTACLEGRGYSVR